MSTLAWGCTMTQNGLECHQLLPRISQMPPLPAEKRKQGASCVVSEKHCQGTDLRCDLPLDGLTTPTSDHRVPFGNSASPDHQFESPLSNPLAPSPDHGVEFDFKTPTGSSSRAKPRGLHSQTSASMKNPKHRRIHGTDDFKPPDNAAATHTDHVKFEKFDLPVLRGEPLLEPAVTPADDHHIKCDDSELSDHNFEVPPEDNPAARLLGHGAELENFETPLDQFALPPMGADAAPSAAHRIELGEFELPEANNIAHLHQAREQLLSHFQRCHKKKQGTMPGHSAATTAHFSSRKKPPDPLEKPQSPTKNSEKPGSSVDATQHFHQKLCCAHVSVVAKFAVCRCQQSKMGSHQSRGSKQVSLCFFLVPPARGCPRVMVGKSWSAPGSWRSGAEAESCFAAVRCCSNSASALDSAAVGCHLAL